VGHIEAQAPEGMPLLALEVLQSLGDLLDRRSQPVEQAQAGIGERDAAGRAVQQSDPRLCSKCRIVWLSAEGVTLKREAAARKLRLSAMATNAVRSARSARRIADFLSVPNETDVGPDLGRQSTH
jgi:hypothetical protein